MQHVQKFLIVNIVFLGETFGNKANLVSLHLSIYMFCILTCIQLIFQEANLIGPKYEF